MISVLFFHVFLVNNWGKYPGGGVLARFYRPGESGFELSFCPGGGICPSKKLPRGFAGGGWSGLELTDTLIFWNISEQVGNRA